MFDQVYLDERLNLPHNGFWANLSSKKLPF